jgi:hypothetical protein
LLSGKCLACHKPIYSEKKQQESTNLEFPLALRKKPLNPVKNTSGRNVIHYVVGSEDRNN